MSAAAEVGEIVEEKGQNSEVQTQELKFSFTYKYYKNPTEFIIIEIRGILQNIYNLCKLFAHYSNANVTYFFLFQHIKNYLLRFKNCNFQFYNI